VDKHYIDFHDLKYSKGKMML